MLLNDMRIAEIPASATGVRKLVKIGNESIHYHAETGRPPVAGAGGPVYIMTQAKEQATLRALSTDLSQTNRFLELDGGRLHHLDR